MLVKLSTTFSMFESGQFVPSAQLLPWGNFRLKCGWGKKGGCFLSTTPTLGSQNLLSSVQNSTSLPRVLGRGRNRESHSAKTKCLLYLRVSRGLCLAVPSASQVGNLKKIINLFSYFTFLLKFLPPSSPPGPCPTSPPQLSTPPFPFRKRRPPKDINQQ